MRVLLTEDEPDIAHVVARALVRDGHVVSIAGSMREAREGLARGTDLLVLDLGLPDGSGLTLCRELRAQHSQLPILILTAQSQSELRVEGLDAGANDYLPKPFAIPELRARVRALGRRAPVTGSPVYTHEDLRIDFTGRRALKAGQQLPVTSREWAILEVLISRRGAPVTRTELLENVWGDGGCELASNSLDVLVARLRRKFGSELIQTVRHQGYCFVGSLSEESPR